jgi:hypothetical protein
VFIDNKRSPSVSRLATAVLCLLSGTGVQAFQSIEVPTASVLFSDDFGAGLSSAWTVVDEGTIDRPSRWRVNAGVLEQTSNIYDGDGSRNKLHKFGTYLLTGDPGWSDYTVSVRMLSTDNDAMGVMFGYLDSGNYYRFSMDQSRNYRRLVKFVNGTPFLLAEDDVAFEQRRWYAVEVSFASGAIEVRLDGQTLFEVNDTSHPGGRVALYSWAQAIAQFDDFVVTGQGGAQTCTFAINPTQASIGSVASTGSVNVTAGSACNWAATSNVAWISITSSGSGSGNGSVNYSVQQNTGTSSRQGTLTIAGQTFAVTQAGASSGTSCSYSLSPTEANVDSGASTGAVNVTAGAGCNWTAASNAGWITIASGMSGSGNGSVNYSVQENTASSSREGALTIAGKTFSVTQAGASVGSQDVTAASGTWYQSGWGYRRAITVPASQVSGGTHSNFPLLVRRTSDADLAAHAQNNGNDLVFTLDDHTTKLDHEIEHFNGATGELAAWVRIPSLSHTADTTIYLYYGNSGAANQQNRNGVWDTHYRGVWHLNNGYSTVAGFYSDSTAHGNHGTLTDANGNTAAAPGQVGGALDLNGDADFLNVGSAASLNNVNPRTLEFWVKRKGTATMQIATKTGTGGFFNAEIRGNGTSSGQNTVRLWERWGNSAGWRGTTEIADPNRFYYVAITYDSGSAGNTPSIYINGVAEPLTTLTAPSGSHASDAANALRIGAASWGEHFQGVMDEVRISSAIRSPGWIATTHSNIHSPETFISVGGPESSGGSSSCTYSLSATQVSVGSSASSGNTVGVTAGSGCAWTATSNTAWIGITGGISGSGNGTVTYSVQANTATASRQGTLTVAGQTFTVTQAGASGGTSCSFTLSPTQADYGAAATTGAVNVTAGAGCNWTAVSNVTWISITSGASGSGNGSMNYSVQANSATASRQGTLTIADQTFTVTQQGFSGTGSTNAGVLFSDDFASTLSSVWTVVDEGTVDRPSRWRVNAGVLEQTSNIFDGDGARNSLPKLGTYLLTGDPNWTAYGVRVRMLSTDNDAMGVMFGYRDSGNYYRFSMDQTRAYRRLVKFVNGRATLLAEDGVAFEQNRWYDVEVSFAGGAIEVRLDGQVLLQANDSSHSSGRVALYSWAQASAKFDDFVVTGQSGTPACSYSISPTQASPGAAASTGTVNVTAGSACNWAAVSNVTWISITSAASGSGSGSVNYSVQENSSTSSRQGTLIIAGQTFTVTQAGAGGGTSCTFTLSATQADVGAAGATGSVNVTAGAGCNWTAVSGVTWISITSGASGSGNGSVNYSVQVNSGASRQGTLTIAGRTFTITQAGASVGTGCGTFILTPTGASLSASATTGSTGVTTGTGCNWTASSNVNWISVTSGGSGSGPGAVSYSVQANSSSSQRQGTLTIGGITFTVSQTGSGCSFNLTPVNATYGAGAYTGSFKVWTTNSCAWRAVSNSSWITITANASQTGTKTVGYAVAANSTPTPRQGSLSVAGQTFNIWQAGTTGASTIWLVPSGHKIQTTLDQAQLGDTIILEPGGVYSGFVRLPKKQGTGFITITTADQSLIPPDGVRINPSYSANLPKLISPDNRPVIQTDPGAHHYRLVGLELRGPNGMYNSAIIRLGTNTQTSLADVPSHIELDRLYIHGDPRVGGNHGVELQSAHTVVKNCYFEDFKSNFQETQAIASWNGPGPFEIINNYIEGAGENVMFGGALARIDGLVPSDITIRRNHFYKPLSWWSRHPSFAGTTWTVKNLFELKNARRVLVEDNIFENNWQQAQQGYAIVLTVRTERGQMPWAVVEDVTFRRNIIRHAGAGVNLLGQDYNGGYQGITRRILFENNLFYDINSSVWGGDGRMFQVLQGVEDLVINHNTLHHNRHLMTLDGLPSPRLVFTNNIAPTNVYGILGTGTTTGWPTFQRYCPDIVLAGNVLAGGPASRYPANNFFPADMDSVGFVDLSQYDYRLSPGSPYRNAGTDGLDVGAAINAILAATEGVIQ